ncbi:MAG: N-acetylmuramoyl-L-alanine amidase [Candidatus Thiodiazotropha sp. (ex Dulcina madagascariensis)]|nr:N-acetylmuramoyl-L-alanine amidase [Candidatus Thiodiazotropha sp. (ex Dulcina madagascariensis)]MCU7925250.1 N-acetylmuramoyl-L-alanine amidase [Candidatus Thiodiazotropha sp. (ex Dulcina madagascariensis)]
MNFFFSTGHGEMRERLTLLLLLFLSSLPLYAKQSEVTGLRIWSAPDHVRLVFDANAQIAHKIFTLKAPDRLVLDLKNATLTEHLPDPTKENKIIRGMRSALRNKRDMRVVFDLNSAVKPKSFSLKPNREYGHRLVIDLYDDKIAASRRSKPVKTAKAVGQRDVVIAVDPGHGGEDPGARGRKGTYEKDVVLAIGRKLVTMINQQQGMRAVLIRDGDYYLGLRKRITKAREHQADLFVSIHADAFNDPRVRGSSVYTLSRSGASNEAARWLAERENSADLVGGVSLEDKDDMLASVLLDLSQIGTLQASSEAASRVFRQLKTLGKTHKRRVQQAGFVVLKSPDIPSMLVEIAFISNPEEERRLRDSGHQRKVAKALMKGVRDYFRYQPPPGTWLAANQAPRKHVISPGDTLIAIANRYHVSVNRLRNANELKGDTIRIGQVLQIPGG